MAKIAYAVRAISSPPLMVMALFFTLYFGVAGTFTSVWELVFSIAFFVIIPALAYVTQPIFKGYKDRGREGQRELAFIFSAIGYLGGVIYGFAANLSRNLKLAYLSYFFSMLLLTLCNKLTSFHASGHACGIAGPIILLIIFMGWKLILPCAIIMAAMSWSSLKLKRHTVQELIFGTAAACGGVALAFACLGFTI